MDGRLIKAAQAGDVDYLLKLMNNEPLVLMAVALSGGRESPLHTACMAGHLSFVKEVLKWRKEFAAELNQDGFSPLHIACTTGDIEIVRELLKVDHNLCRLKGKEGRVPLHYAAINGRVNVIRELLSASANSIEDLTARGETALHLAVKNHQFEAFKALLDHIKQFKKEDALNKRDCQGNTILHLAALRKQYEVVDLVCNGDVLTKGALEVNLLDKRGLTPLDVLLLLQNETSDREIEEILRRAGAITSEDLHPEEASQIQVHRTNNSPLISGQSSLEHSLSPSKRLLEYFKYNRTRDSPSEIRNCLLVIAILIATATYQAVLSPPGGVWQDDYKSSNDKNTNTNIISRTHRAGHAVMGTHNPTYYGLFLVFNSFGFFFSLHMINYLTVGFPLRLELQVSLVALIGTYDTSMVAIGPDSGISILFTILSLLMPFGVPFATKMIRDHLRIPGSVLARTNQASTERRSVDSLSC